MKQLLAGFILGILVAILAVVLYATEARSQEVDSLTALIRGRVTDQYGHRVDTGTIRSNGVCATAVTRGEYLCSEIYCSWTLTFRASGYNTKSYGITVDSMSERKDFRVRCDDRDSDGVCDVDDNCPKIPNGPRAGTCMMKKGCTLFVTQCDRDVCGCDCLLSQEIDPCLDDFCY